MKWIMDQVVLPIDQVVHPIGHHRLTRYLEPERYQSNR